MTNIKSLVCAFLLAGAIQAKDHNSHNCCTKATSNLPWEPNAYYTQIACSKYPGKATYDSSSQTCNENYNGAISGSDFYNKCREAGQASAGNNPGFNINNYGAGYRNTC
ncbi:hypothetical protein FCOIX_3469 [Fusarium coicis]|nr:hypothetical protein FCOIX_3469 [Fusarium coicis]